MSYKILLVDDEPALRHMVRDILLAEQYIVFTAATCAEGAAVATAERPDAVLLDVMLPDGDGFSLFQRLRQERDVPVLFLSARDEDEARLRGLGLGADDYITKPFLPKELCLRLAAVLRRVYGQKQTRFFDTWPPHHRLGHRNSIGRCTTGVADRQRICLAAQTVVQPRQHRDH